MKDNVTNIWYNGYEGNYPKYKLKHLYTLINNYNTFYIHSSERIVDCEKCKKIKRYKEL